MTTTMDLPTAPTNSVLNWALDLALAPIVRPISEWVEQEIILPNGPLGGLQYRHRYHPVSRLLFEEIDSGRWNRIAVTAPTQNGKTLMAYVLPVLYHLFELKETVVIGLPDMKMANDKWQEDFLPVIEASDFSELLPTTGEGSRGGQVKRGIRFRNGATMRFMTAGGGDKNRAAFTARTIAITETDGMDEAGEASREADKITQIEARSRAFGDNKRVYLECTVSIERGRIWQEVKNGSDSRIVRPCPHCGAWVSPEREHLVGWKEAKSEGEARELSHWTCPECSATWSEEDKQKASKSSKLLHSGQEIQQDGTITGSPPKTKTLGFRWSAIDNPFTTAGQIGAEEWRATKAPNRENAEKEMRQFVWCLPYEPPEIELTHLEVGQICERTSTLKRGIVPADALGVVVGIDTGKRELNWTAIATMPDRDRIIEYNQQKVDADTLGVYGGLLKALEELRSYFASAWQSEVGSPVMPLQVWIDSGYHEHTDAVYDFCHAANHGLQFGAEIWRPSKGYGEMQKIGRYIAPERRHSEVLFVGNNYHISRVRRNGKRIAGVLLVHMNADDWKSKVHQRLAQPAGEAGSLTLFSTADPEEHRDFATQLTAERQVENFSQYKGTVITWERISRNNHKLDSTYAALAASDFVRQNITTSKPSPASRPTARDLAAKGRQ